MKYLFLLILVIPFIARGQKPVIDSAAINHWVSLGGDDDVAISGDGKYVAYIIENQPIRSRTVVIQSTIDNWKQEFQDASPGFFSRDDKQYVCMIKNTLCFFNISTRKTKYINGVSDLQQPYESIGEWVCWRQTDSLVVHNLLTGREKKYTSVKDYLLNKKGNALLLKTSAGLELVSFFSGNSSKISNDTLVNNYTFDSSGTQVAFIVNEELWYYKMGMDKAILKANKYSGIKPGLHIQGTPSFSGNGHYILFGLQEADFPKKRSDISLDIWSYKDTIIQSTQLYQLQPKIFLGVIGVDEKKIIQLQQDYETSKIPPTGDYMLFEKTQWRSFLA